MRDADKAFTALDRYIGQQMDVGSIPGIAVGVADRATLLRVSTYGFADVAAKTAVTPETLFEIGSIGKSFTSIALLQLQEAGRLDLHDPITNYLPWFKLKSGHRPITLQHLMSHTAAITGGPELPGEARSEVWALRDTEATAPPGTYYHYSDSGYKALGVVLEEVLGQSYGDVIRARILDPLGMRDTEPTITNETRGRLAVGYEAADDDRPPPPDRPLAPATWLEHAEGAGSIASTAADMATYLRMLLNRGQGADRRIFSEESFELMTQRIIEADDEGEGCFYGYGLAVRTSRGHTVISHSGGMVGFYAYMAADLDDGLGVIVLSNGPVGQADAQIADVALGLLSSSLHDGELPPVPAPTRSPKVADADGYTGTYAAAGPDPAIGPNQAPGGTEFSIEADGEQLTMRVGDDRVALERRGPNTFYVDHPDFALFLLRFGRTDGEVVEAFHGPRWYMKADYSGPTTFDHPGEWSTYPGHYRSHNPWLSNFRVVLRKGKLALIHPSGEEEPMEPSGGTVFRVGGDDRSPDRIRFDAIVNGQALRANLSCCDYYRTFTP